MAQQTNKSPKLRRSPPMVADTFICFCHASRTCGFWIMVCVGAGSEVTFAICFWTNVWPNAPTSTTCKKSASGSDQTFETDSHYDTFSCFSGTQANIGANMGANIETLGTQSLKCYIFSGLFFWRCLGLNLDGRGWKKQAFGLRSIAKNGFDRS